MFFYFNDGQGVKFDPQSGSVLHIELARSNSRRKRNIGIVHESINFQAIVHIHNLDIFLFSLLFHFFYSSKHFSSILPNLFILMNYGDFQIFLNCVGLNNFIKLLLNKHLS